MADDKFLDLVSNTTAWRSDPASGLNHRTKAADGQNVRQGAKNNYKPSYRYPEPTPTVSDDKSANRVNLAKFRDGIKGR